MGNEINLTLSFEVLQHYFSNPHPEVEIPYIIMEWNNDVMEKGGTCLDKEKFINTMLDNDYIAYKVPSKDDDYLIRIYKLDWITSGLIDILWAKKSAHLLPWYGNDLEQDT